MRLWDRQMGGAVPANEVGTRTALQRSVRYLLANVLGRPVALTFRPMWMSPYSLIASATISSMLGLVRLRSL